MRAFENVESLPREGGVEAVVTVADCDATVHYRALQIRDSSRPFARSSRRS